MLGLQSWLNLQVARALTIAHGGNALLRRYRKCFFQGGFESPLGLLEENDNSARLTDSCNRRLLASTGVVWPVLHSQALGRCRVSPMKGSCVFSSPTLSIQYHSRLKEAVIKASAEDLYSVPHLFPKPELNLPSSLRVCVTVTYNRKYDSMSWADSYTLKGEMTHLFLERWNVPSSSRNWT